MNVTAAIETVDAETAVRRLGGLLTASEARSLASCEAGASAHVARGPSPLSGGVLARLPIHIPAHTSGGAEARAPCR